MGRFIARVFVGGILAGHGLQKLFGWFGGPGPEGAAQMMESLEIRPARRSALLAGGVETAGGAMLAAGLLTPFAGAALTGNMITAIRTVHWANGIWNTNGGWEFPATLIGAVIAIVDAGPGPFSADEALGFEASGSTWALLSLAAGAIGSVIVVETGRKTAPEPSPPDASQSAAPDVPAGAAA
jgi:putative oxidoreductase